MTSKADRTLITQARRAMRNGTMPPAGVRINFGDPDQVQVTHPQPDPEPDPPTKKPKNQAKGAQDG